MAYRLRFLALGLAITLLGATTGIGLRVAIAAFTDTAPVAQNTFATRASFSNCRQPSTPLWLTGLEYGYFSVVGGGLFSAIAGGGGMPSVDSGVFRSGAYSLRIAKGSNAGSWAEQVLPGSSATVVSRFAIRLAALPSANVTQLATIRAAAGSSLHLGYATVSQSLQLRFGSGTPVTATSSVVAGNWYVVEVNLNLGTNPRTADWRIDGLTQGQVTAAEAPSTAAALRFGSAVNAESFTAHYDDIITTANAADYPIGTGRVRRLVPNGMGTHSGPENFQDNQGGVITASTYARLDEVPINTIPEDFVKQVIPSAASYLELTFQDPGETCITGVSAVLSYDAEGTTGNDGRAAIFSGTTETVVYSGAMNTTAPTYKSAVVAAATPPWTQAALNAIVGRVGYSSDASPNPYWHALLIEYDVGGP